jgi:hypothetical protein
VVQETIPEVIPQEESVSLHDKGAKNHPKKSISKPHHDDKKGNSNLNADAKTDKKPIVTESVDHSHDKKVITSAIEGYDMKPFRKVHCDYKHDAYDSVKVTFANMQHIFTHVSSFTV